MIKIVFIALILLTGKVYSQGSINIDDYKQIYINGKIEWPVLKKENLFYLKNDSNKLANGIFKYTYEENSFINAHYFNGECLKKIDYYINGNIHSELIYENNKVKDGVYTFFYVNGEREEIKTYLDGKLNGVNISFYKSKKIASITNYKDGERNGLIVTFYENGQLSEEIMTKDGKKNGLSISYYESGQKAMEKYYLNTFKLGNGCQKFWYPNGILAWEVCYDEKGNRNGIEKAYDDWGVLKYQKEWKDNLVKSKKQFGSLENLWFPNIVEGHREKMQYYFDKDDW